MQTFLKFVSAPSCLCEPHTHHGFIWNLFMLWPHVDVSSGPDFSHVYKTADNRKQTYEYCKMDWVKVTFGDWKCCLQHNYLPIHLHVFGTLSTETDDRWLPAGNTGNFVNLKLQKSLLEQVEILKTLQILLLLPFGYIKPDLPEGTI